MFSGISKINSLIKQTSFIFHNLIFIYFIIFQVAEAIRYIFQKHKLKKKLFIKETGLYCTVLYCTVKRIRTVSVTLRYPPCKDDNARFTTVLLKALSDQVELDINVYNVKN